MLQPTPHPPATVWIREIESLLDGSRPLPKPARDHGELSRTAASQRPCFSPPRACVERDPHVRSRLGCSQANASPQPSQVPPLNERQPVGLQRRLPLVQSDQQWSHLVPTQRIDGIGLEDRISLNGFDLRCSGSHRLRSIFRTFATSSPVLAVVARPVGAPPLYANPVRRWGAVGPAAAVISAGASSTFRRLRHDQSEGWD